MDQTRKHAQQARWSAFAQQGLPVLGSAFLLAIAVVCGLVMLPG